MSELTELVMKQENEMYLLGRKHGAIENLMQIKIDIRKLDDKGAMTIEKSKVDVIIESRIANLIGKEKK